MSKDITEDGLEKEFMELRAKYKALHPDAEFPREYARDTGRTGVEIALAPTVKDLIREQGKTEQYAYCFMVMTSAKIILSVINAIKETKYKVILRWDGGKEKFLTDDEIIAQFRDYFQRDTANCNWKARSIGRGPKEWLSCWFGKDTEIRRNVDAMVDSILQAIGRAFKPMKSDDVTYIFSYAVFACSFITNARYLLVDQYCELIAYKDSFWNECFKFAKAIAMSKEDYRTLVLKHNRTLLK